MVERWWWIANTVALTLLSGFGIALLTEKTATVSAQTDREIFADVESDYWAAPFINTLAAEGIVAGYPDGTFRPQQAIDRDEFAALVRQAFDQESVRTIPSGSVFEDVPERYWAETAIEEAFEAGFLSAFEDSDLFYPQAELTRVEGIAALVNGLDLQPTQLALEEPTETPVPTEQASLLPQQQVQKFLLALSPLTTLMQPLFAVAAPQQPQQAASEFVAYYLADANDIPPMYVDEVAIATAEGIVVNYPNVNQFNPTESLNRGAAAAFVHQAMVSQGKLEPITPETQAFEYIVNPAGAGQDL